MKKTIVLLTCTVLAACGGDTTTGPTNVPDKGGNIPTNTVAQVPNVTPTPEVENQKGDNPGPVTAHVRPDGSARITNTATVAKNGVFVLYTKNGLKQPVYYTFKVPTIAPGEAFQLPPAQEVLAAIIPEPSCEPFDFDKLVQVDVEHGAEHIGHATGVQVTLHQDALPVEEAGKPTIEIVFGEWGECTAPELNLSTVAEAECSRSRSVTTTTTQLFTCGGEPVITVVETTETESCRCPCLDVPPVITYGDPGEFGQCKPEDLTLTAASDVSSSCHGSHQCPPLPTDGSIHPKQRNPTDECGHFGAAPVGKDDRWPWHSVPDGDFYLLKQATWMRVYHSKPNPYTLGSHVTSCVCEEECIPEFVTECQYRDVFEQICDNDPVKIGEELVNRRTRDINECPR